MYHTCSNSQLCNFLHIVNFFIVLDHVGLLRQLFFRIAIILVTGVCRRDLFILEKISPIVYCLCGVSMFQFSQDPERSFLIKTKWSFSGCNMLTAKFGRIVLGGPTLIKHNNNLIKFIYIITKRINIIQEVCQKQKTSVRNNFICILIKLSIKLVDKFVIKSMLRLADQLRSTKG